LRQHDRLRQVPLVVYTGKDLDDAERERLRLGETLLLTKGHVRPEVFEQRVLELLRRIAQRQAADVSDGGQGHADH